jgi:hypothetical protein
MGTGMVAAMGDEGAGHVSPGFNTDILPPISLLFVLLAMTVVVVFGEIGEEMTIPFLGISITGSFVGSVGSGSSTLPIIRSLAS